MADIQSTARINGSRAPHKIRLLFGGVFNEQRPGICILAESIFYTISALES